MITLAAKRRELQDFTVQEPSGLELGRLRKDLSVRLAHFDDLLHADVPIARQALRKLLGQD